MKKLFVLFVLISVITGVSSAAGAGNKDVVGTWKYSVPSAPEGMTAGDIIIKEADNGSLAGKVVFQDGSSVELKNVKYAGVELSFGLNVESEYVSVKAKVTGKKMEGQVTTPEGLMSITAEMAEKK